MDDTKQSDNNFPLAYKIGLGGDAAVSAVITGWWWANYEGLYRIIAELQPSIFGGYYPISTGVITFCMVFAVLSLPMVFLRLTAKQREKERSHRAVQSGATQQELPCIAKNLTPCAIFGSSLAALGWMLIVAGVCAGAYFIIRGVSAGGIVAVNIEDIYERKVPEGGYIETSGMAIVEGKIAVREPSSRSDVFYFPLVPKSWRKGEPVMIVVKTENAEAASGTGGRFAGVVSAFVPGFQKGLLEETDFNIAPNAVLLEIDKTPSSLAALGVFICVGMSLAGLVAIKVARKRQAR